ncbi:MAG: hypothetical protein J6A15_01275 [Clostridia bacterium]|nr:hypothetical protein [Clostridia bacterium]
MNYLKAKKMTSCNYHVLNDIEGALETQLASIANKIDELDLDVKIDELDVDLDNLEAQLKIANKLKLLEAIGTDVMTEEDQNAAYTAIKNELFSSTSEAASGGDTDSSGD